MDEFLFVGGPWGDAFATIGETRMSGAARELVRSKPERTL